MNTSMHAGQLTGRAVLVVEDDYFLAHQLAAILEAEGARVLGPAGTLTEALDLASTAEMDAALLDVNLRHLTVQPVVDVLERRGVPLLLLTGAAEDSLPVTMRGLPLVRKPIDEAALLASLAGCS
ncbi:response regulator [Rhodobacter sp. NSM]|uniref:response regulator n=1 Tax=Rhodobacter sp. NSM TaxID=3457501 RepID=UPI003FCFB659